MVTSNVMCILCTHFGPNYVATKRFFIKYILFQTCKIIIIIRVTFTIIKTFLCKNLFHVINVDTLLFFSLSIIVLFTYEFAFSWKWVLMMLSWNFQWKCRRCFWYLTVHLLYPSRNYHQSNFRMSMSENKRIAVIIP